MNSIFKLKHFRNLVLLSALFFVQTAFSNENSLIRLATTTSTDNSGLLNYLLPEFEKDSHYKTHVIAVGTGKALRMGRDGDVDVLLVHALNAEKKFVAEGYAKERFPVMYNDFVIVGPKAGNDKFSSAKNIADALTIIAASGKRFVSRGDDSGTHKKELSLWKAAKIDLKNKQNNWYIEAGQGMGKVLQMAGEMDAYTLTDRGTWLAYQSKSPLTIAFEGDSTLFNPYGILAVNPVKYPDLNNAGAKALISWITSDKGQRLIGNFKVSGKRLFTPSVSSQASASQ